MLKEVERLMRLDSGRGGLGIAQLQYVRLVDSQVIHGERRVRNALVFTKTCGCGRGLWQYHNRPLSLGARVLSDRGQTSRAVTPHIFAESQVRGNRRKNIRDEFQTGAFEARSGSPVKSGRVGNRQKKSCPSTPREASLSS